MAQPQVDQLVPRRSAPVRSPHSEAAQAERFRFPWTLIAVCAAIAFRVPWDFSLFHDVDEGVLAAAGDTIRRGGLLYRDAWCHRGPVLHHIYALIFTIVGGRSMVAVHLVTSACLGLQAYLLYRLARRFFPVAVAGVAAFLFAFFSTVGFTPLDGLGASVEIWMNLFVLLSLAAVVAAAEESSRAKFFAAGVLLGLAGLTKQVGFFVYPLLILSVVYANSWNVRSRSAARPAAGKLPYVLITAGTAFPVILLCAYYKLRGAWSEFANLFIDYNFLYLSMGSAADVGAPWSTALLQYAERALQHLLAVAQPRMSFLLYGLALVAIVCVVIDWRRPGRELLGEHARRPAFFLVWLALSALPVLLLNRGFGHYYIALLPPLSVLAALMMVVVWRATADARAARVVVAFFFLFHLAYPALHFLKAELPLFRNERAKPLFQVADYVKTRSAPEDKVFYWGWASEFYTLADRPNASRFIFCTFLTDTSPGSRYGSGQLGYKNAVELWRKDLKRERPLFIVDGHAGAGEHMLRSYALQQHAKAWRFIQNNYDLAAEMNGYLVYRRRTDVSLQ